jgi:peroxiredoxin
MKKESLIGRIPTDFSLTDTKGNKVTLADFRGKRNVVLVFNRGFA